MEKVTRTFIEKTHVTYQPVVGGNKQEPRTTVFDGKVSDPIKACKKEASLGKLDTVIILEYKEESCLYSMPVDTFLEHATLEQ